MILGLNRSRRSGATAVEIALVYPPLLLFTFGLIVVGLGIFRYQETAALAREGARWACVHGGQWATEQNLGTLTTSTDVYNNAILLHAAGLDTSKLTYSVTWDDSGQMPTYTSGASSKTNKVTVTVNYSWVPELYLGSMTLSSTSETTVSY
jgi:Flp pilus assembly protein TadG